MNWSKLEYRYKDDTYMAIEQCEGSYTILFQQWEKIVPIGNNLIGSLLMTLESFYDYPDRNLWGHDKVFLRALQTDSPTWKRYILSAPGIDVEGSEGDMNSLRTLLNCIMDLENGS